MRLRVRTDGKLCCLRAAICVLRPAAYFAAAQAAAQAATQAAWFFMRAYAQ